MSWEAVRLERVPAQLLEGLVKELTPLKVFAPEKVLVSESRVEEAEEPPPVMPSEEVETSA